VQRDEANFTFGWLQGPKRQRVALATIPAEIGYRSCLGKSALDAFVRLGFERRREDDSESMVKFGELLR
jgi:hypothetical protein